MNLFPDPDPPKTYRGLHPCEILQSMMDLREIEEPDKLAAALAATVRTLKPDQLRRVAATVLAEMALTV